MKLPMQLPRPTCLMLALLSILPIQIPSVRAELLAQSLSLQPTESTNQSPIFVAPSPPPNIGEPGRRSDAGTRGPGRVLTALAPSYTSSQPELVFGATAAEYPTLWFYVPHHAPVASVVFVMRDANGNLIYETDFELVETPGVISVSPSPTVVPLVAGKPYHWFFKIYCDTQSPPDAFVEGWIQREALTPALANQFENASPQERVALYAANGLWYEALTTAAELRRRDPGNQDWTALLEAVGLENLAAELIVDCCQPEN